MIACHGRPVPGHLPAAALRAGAHNPVRVGAGGGGERAGRPGLRPRHPRLERPPGRQQQHHRLQPVPLSGAPVHSIPGTKSRELAKDSKQMLKYNYLQKRIFFIFSHILLSFTPQSSPSISHSQSSSSSTPRSTSSPGVSLTGSVSSVSALWNDNTEASPLATDSHVLYI